MHFILDHIASVVIAGVILLILLSLTYRGQDTTHEATMYYTAKTSMLSMVEWIEQDFKNIGSGKKHPDSSIVALDTLGATKRFRFYAKQYPTDNNASVIEYEWEQDGTVDLDTATVPLYIIRRKVDSDSSGTWELTGWSQDTVTDFRIRLLTADSTNAATLAEARQVHVLVKAVSPLGVGELIEQTTWSKIFRPVNFFRFPPPAP
jgi:hypothetical protein